MKIIILGANGMLGKDVMKAFSNTNHDVYGYDKSVGDIHSFLDITDANSVREMFETINPDVVVNCVGYTAVDQAERDRMNASNINSQCILHLIHYCNEHNAKLIHFSTDYVFDGTATIPYKEEDETCPINYYGETKDIADGAIESYSKNYIIFRISWLYGGTGKNFVNTIKNRLLENKITYVVNDQIGSPTTTTEVAKAVVFFADKDYQGILNITNAGGGISWHTFAKAIEIYLGKENLVYPCCSSEYKTEAKRPTYSVLDISRIQSLVNYKITTWNRALKDYLNEGDRK